MRLCAFPQSRPEGVRPPRNRACSATSFEGSLPAGFHVRRPTWSCSRRSWSPSESCRPGPTLVLWMCQSNRAREGSYRYVFRLCSTHLARSFPPKHNALGPRSTTEQSQSPGRVEPGRVQRWPPLVAQVRLVFSSLEPPRLEGAACGHGAGSAPRRTTDGLPPVATGGEVRLVPPPDGWAPGSQAAATRGLRDGRGVAPSSRY